MSYNDQMANGFPNYQNPVMNSYYQYPNQDYNYNPYLMNQPPHMPPFNFTDMPLTDDFSFHGLLPPPPPPPQQQAMQDNRWPSPPLRSMDHTLDPNDAMNFPEADDASLGQWGGMYNYSPFYYPPGNEQLNTKESGTVSLDDEENDIDDDLSQQNDDGEGEFDIDLPDGITREDLITKGIPELNKLLKELGVNKDMERDIKKLRRQYKNRGYAQVCREKKMKKKSSMKGQKDKLEKEIDTLRKDVENLRKERDRFKAHYDNIHYTKNTLQNHQ